MPIHDWTRVPAGTWHDFHFAWISAIRTALNDGLLPSEYYALAEQIVGPLGPDVLRLKEADVPLEATYLAACRGVPRRWRDVLEAPPHA